MVEATYSAALNFMLLAAIHEASRPGGLAPETREIVWDFARDARTIGKLNLHERLDAVRSALLRGEHGEPAAPVPRPRRTRTHADRVGEAQP